MLKIVATISDFGAAANIGAHTEYTSVVINVPTSNIPDRLKKHLEHKATGKANWETLSFSLLDEET